MMAEVVINPKSPSFQAVPDFWSLSCNCLSLYPSSDWKLSLKLWGHQHRRRRYCSYLLKRQQSEPGSGWACFSLLLVWKTVLLRKIWAQPWRLQPGLSERLLVSILTCWNRKKKTSLMSHCSSHSIQLHLCDRVYISSSFISRPVINTPITTTLLGVVTQRVATEVVVV